MLILLEMSYCVVAVLQSHQCFDCVGEMPPFLLYARQAVMEWLLSHISIKRFVFIVPWLGGQWLGHLRPIAGVIIWAGYVFGVYGKTRLFLPG